MALRFESLRLAGWKSLKDATIAFRPLNLLIGGNGAGKSNLISYFELLQASLKGNLTNELIRQGGANAVLHYGAKQTKEVYGRLVVNTEGGRGTLHHRLLWKPPDALAPSSTEGIPPGADRSRVLIVDGDCAIVPDPDAPGHPEILIHAAARDRIAIHHFHDTTSTAAIRSVCAVNDNRSLKRDGANLAAVLHLYHQRFPIAFNRIKAAVRAVAPYFDDFALQPLRLNPNNIMLEWRTKGSDYVLGPHQLSDGTIRFIALSTLLLQPDEDRPALLILDEPELGLHPAALAVLADLLKLAAERTCLLVATQSATLIDHFTAEDVVTVNLKDGRTVFERLEPEQFKHWLDDFTLSELWEQNVIGGGPY